MLLDTVAHTCNPKYSRGGDRDDLQPKQKVYMTLMSTKNAVIQLHRKHKQKDRYRGQPRHEHETLIKNYRPGPSGSHL
jgi:hypothetical protein